MALWTKRKELCDFEHKWGCGIAVYVAIAKRLYTVLNSERNIPNVFLAVHLIGQRLFENGSFKEVNGFISRITSFTVVLQHAVGLTFE